MTATARYPERLVAYGRLYDALKHVDVRLELDLTQKTRGICAIGFIDPGAGRLTFTGTTLEGAARMAITFGPDRARDYGVVAALQALRAQQQLDDATGQPG